MRPLRELRRASALDSHYSEASTSGSGIGDGSCESCETQELDSTPKAPSDGGKTLILGEFLDTSSEAESCCSESHNDCNGNGSSASDTSLGSGGGSCWIVPRHIAPGKSK